MDMCLTSFQYYYYVDINIKQVNSFKTMLRPLLICSDATFLTFWGVGWDSVGCLQKSSGGGGEIGRERGCLGILPEKKTWMINSEKSKQAVGLVFHRVPCDHALLQYYTQLAGKWCDYQNCQISLVFWWPLFKYKRNGPITEVVHKACQPSLHCDVGGPAPAWPWPHCILDPDTPTAAWCLGVSWRLCCAGWWQEARLQTGV